MTKKSEMIGFKTTPEIRTRLEEIAKREDRSLSYVINKILEKELVSAKPVIVEKIAAKEGTEKKKIMGDMITIDIGNKK